MRGNHKEMQSTNDEVADCPACSILASSGRAPLGRDPLLVPAVTSRKPGVGRLVIHANRGGESKSLSRWFALGVASRTSYYTARAAGLSVDLALADAALTRTLRKAGRGG